jgi:uncharacterized protein YndB with AHSA1/START domain
MAITRHVYRIHIKAPIDTVWNALVDPAFTRRYFHGTAFDEPPRAGQPYRTSLPDGRGAVDGVIEEMSPPNRLVMTWHTLYAPALAEEPPSRVEWTLTEAGDGLTQVDLVHGDLAHSPLTWANVRHGWTWILNSLKTLLETGDDLPPVTADTSATDGASDDVAGEWHRAQAVECNNATWEMVEADRTPDNDEEMLRRAYASAYHWQRAARSGPENEARALYMLSKVHLLAGQPQPAMSYADRCMAQCQQHGLVDFDLAYAHEARARALQALDRFGEAADAWAAAKAVPIANSEDQAILDGDLAVGL